MLTFRTILLQNVMQFSTCPSYSHFALYCDKYNCENTCNLLTFKIHCENINCGNSCDLLTFSILLLLNVIRFSTCSLLSHFDLHCKKYDCEDTCDLLTFEVHCENINCGNSCDLLTFSILLLRNVMQFSTCSSLSHFAIH